MQVKIKNYQVVEDLDFEIEGITVISGKSNNGKSSIFRAIQAGCLGQSGSDFVKDGESSTVVALAQDKEMWTWRRAGTVTTFYYGAKAFVKTGGVPPEEYEKPLGINRITVGKFSLTPNFAPQFEQLFVIGLSPVDAASALSFLFSGEKFPNLLKTISATLRQSKKDITFAEGNMNVLDADVVRMKGQLAEVEKYQELMLSRQYIKESAEDYEGLLEAAVLLQTIEMDLRGMSDRRDLIDEKLKKIPAVSEDVVTEIESLEEDIEEVESAQDYLNALIREVIRYEARVDAMKDLSEVLATEIEQLVEDIGGVQTGRLLLDEADSKTSAIKRELEPIEAEVQNKAKELQECPYCTGSLDDQKRDKLLSALSKED